MLKNNLNKDFSPYLLQHKNNPVHWQTWSDESLQFAKKKKKNNFNKQRGEKKKREQR